VSGVGSARIDVAELRRRLGERRHVAGELAIDDVEVGDVAIDADVPVSFDVDLESVSGGIELVGVVHGRWRAPCRRCLDPVGGVIDVDVRELFEDHPTDGETYPIDHECIVLLPLLRDAVAGGLPIAPLCREDCPGPDPAGYPVGVAGPEAVEAERAKDPRWAALDVLRAQFADSDFDDTRD